MYRLAFGMRTRYRSRMSSPVRTMLRRLIAVLCALCIGHVAVASGAEPCVQHAPAHCGRAPAHAPVPVHHHEGGTSECCQLGVACTPWALTAAATSQPRPAHAAPSADDATAIGSPRLAPEPPPPRA
jgi:hypothetical protein